MHLRLAYNILRSVQNFVTFWTNVRTLRGRSGFKLSAYEKEAYSHALGGIVDCLG